MLINCAKKNPSIERMKGRIPFLESLSPFKFKLQILFLCFFPQNMTFGVDAICVESSLFFSTVRGSFVPFVGGHAVPKPSLCNHLLHENLSRKSYKKSKGSFQRWAVLKNGNISNHSSIFNFDESTRTNRREYILAKLTTFIIMFGAILGGTASRQFDLLNILHRARRHYASL